MIIETNKTLLTLTPIERARIESIYYTINNIMEHTPLESGLVSNVTGEIITKSDLATALRVLGSLGTDYFVNCSVE